MVVWEVHGHLGALPTCNTTDQSTSELESAPRHRQLNCMRYGKLTRCIEVGGDGVIIIVSHPSLLVFCDMVYLSIYTPGRQRAKHHPPRLLTGTTIKHQMPKTGVAIVSRRNFNHVEPFALFRFYKTPAGQPPHSARMSRLIEQNQDG